MAITVSQKMSAYIFLLLSGQFSKQCNTKFIAWSRVTTHTVENGWVCQTLKVSCCTLIMIYCLAKSLGYFLTFSCVTKAQCKKINFISWSVIWRALSRFQSVKFVPLTWLPCFLSLKRSQKHGILRAIPFPQERWSSDEIIKGIIKLYFYRYSSN